MERVDSLLQELSSRHSNTDPQFLASVRPMVVAILDPATPEQARVGLLELLAETFERDRGVRRSCAAAKVSLVAWVESMKRFFGFS